MSVSRVALFSTVIAGLAAAGYGSSVLGQGQSASPAGSGGCTPIETREANAPEQKPAFPGQTRVCEAKSNVAFDVTWSRRGWRSRGRSSRCPTAPAGHGEAGAPAHRLRGRTTGTRRSPAFPRSTPGARVACWTSRSARRSPATGRSSGASPSRAKAATRPASRAGCSRRTDGARAGPRDLPRPARVQGRRSTSGRGSRSAPTEDALSSRSASDPTKPCGRRRSSWTATWARSSASRPTAPVPDDNPFVGQGEGAARDLDLGHRNVQGPPSMRRDGSGRWSTGPTVATS